MGTNVIQGVRARIMRDVPRGISSEVRDNVVAHIDRAMATHHLVADHDTVNEHVNDTVKDHVKNSLFRTVDEFSIWSRPAPPPPPYSDIDRIRDELDVLSVLNCHNGQKKLTLSVLEFLAFSLMKLKCAQNEVIVVYAGASGLASVVAANIFKDVKFVLYDPAPNTVALMPRFEDKVVYKTPLQGKNTMDTSKQIIIFTDCFSFLISVSERPKKQLWRTCSTRNDGHS